MGKSVKTNVIGIDADNLRIENNLIYGLRLDLQWYSECSTGQSVYMTATLNLDGCPVARAFGRLASGFIIQRQAQERKIGSSAITAWMDKEIHWSVFSTEIIDPVKRDKAIAEAAEVRFDSMTPEEQAKYITDLQAKQKAVVEDEPEDEEDEPEDEDEEERPEEYRNGDVITRTNS